LERLIESAALAVARLDEALVGSELQSAWQWTRTIDAALRATADDGSKVDRGAFLAVQAQLPIHPEARDEEAMAEARISFQALQLAFGLLTPWDGDSAATAAAVQDDAGRITEHVRTATGARLRALAVTLGEMIPGRRQAILVPALTLSLRECGLCRHLLPHVGRPLSTEPDPASLLESIRRDADQGHALLMGLGHTLSRWRRQLAQFDDHQGLTRRSSSRAPALLSQLLMTPVITPDLCATLIGTSARGAAIILEQLEGAGILSRADPGLRWRAWIPGCFPEVADALHIARGLS
jgi:hypothetical protein